MAGVPKAALGQLPAAELLWALCVVSSTPPAWAPALRVKGGPQSSVCLARSIGGVPQTLLAFAACLEHCLVQMPHWRVQEFVGP